MKPIGSDHDDSDSPEPGGQGRRARRAGRDDLIIVPLEDDFDIDAVFRSEGAPAEMPAAAPDPAAAPASAVAQAPAAEETGAVRVDTEPVAVAAHSAALPVTLAESRALVSAPAPVEDVDRRITPEPTGHDRVKTSALSIADLIDNHVHLEWHEAVAIALHLCRVMSRDPGANVHRSLVEPWNVEITNAGEVQVLPGGSSSDPLVKQVGRVLRALLQDSIAPAELRLVASQASFEVPVYGSVDELSEALKRFERAGDSEAIRAAFNRGFEAKFSAFPAYERLTPAVRPPAVKPHAQARRAKGQSQAPPPPKPAGKRSGSGMFAATAAAAVAVAAMAIFLAPRFTDVGNLWSFVSAPAPRQALAEAPPPAPPPRERPDAVPAPEPAPPALPARERVPAPGAPAISRRARGTGGVPGPGVLPPAPRSPVPALRSPEPVARPAPAGDSFDSVLRRASALLAEGRDGEAAVIFDGIVIKSPLYQLDPARFTAETLAAFQNRKRLLLPAMARRYYQDARVAYDAGDFSLALTKGERALALLRDADIDPADADLHDEVSNLMTLATSARTLEEAKIYTSADRDVTPPRPIGRQLSTASLSGRAPLTGRLQLVVGLSGEVETVRLDTPVNGYHDRMIVSAAKAWHYRPALRKGRPVRYSMVMSITLPDF